MKNNTDKNSLDWDRTAHLFKLGIIAAVIALIGGDMLLGWGTVDESLSGMEQYFSRYAVVSDLRVFWAALLGFIAITIETMCFFGTYRLIDSVSHKTAHIYRAGLIGMLVSGPLCHILCCADIYHFNAVNRINHEYAIDEALRFAKMFLVPVTVIFLIYFILMYVVQIWAFLKGKTPYPRWCWIFCMLTGVVDIIIMKIIGNHAWAYALSTGWLSFGCIVTFSGLLINMNKAKKNIPA